MRLISLQLNNFRQFYGLSPELHFLHGEKNVTVFLGTNGAGKTTLLNSFNWLLYGTFTKGFLLPEQLVNKRAIREAQEGSTVEAWVQLKFEHDGRKYVIKKIAQVLKTGNENGWVPRGELAPTLQWAGPDGKWNNEERISDIIGRILPEDLHTYFFFDGERIERIMQPTKKEREEIANAAKKLLGVEILDRAIIHLNSVRKDLESELKEVGDAETKKLVEEKQAAEEECKNIYQRQEELDRNIDGQQERKTEIDLRLRQLDEVKNIQAKRDELTAEKEKRIKSLQSTGDQLAKEITSNAYSIFLGYATQSFQDLIDLLRKRGELPSGIKTQFVKDLLDKKICICNSPLEESSIARKAVEDWMGRAGLADVEEKAIRMGGEVTKIEQSIPGFWGRVDQLQDRRRTDREEISRIEDELDEIREKLRNNPKEEISSLEKQRDEAEAAIIEANREKGSNDEKIRALYEKIDSLDSKIVKHQANEERQKLAQRRVEAANDALARIKRSRQIFDVYFRDNLLKRITKLFSTMSFTPYRPTLSEDYELGLVDSQGKDAMPVAASTGESQIMSLSFIGSIIEEARANHAKKEGLPGPDSSTFPVVMDSPFGYLSDNYRFQVGEHIPKLASQVVVMVSNTQWRGKVEQAMSGKVNKTYVLVYYTTEDNFDKEFVEINGNSYDLVVQSPNGFEYSEIVEVN